MRRRAVLVGGVALAVVAIGSPVGIALAAAAATPPATPGGPGTSCQASGTGAALAASAAKGAGFPAEQLTMAVAIAGAESDYVPTATNLNTNGSTDYGLWEINSVHPDVLALGDWRDPATNARMAKLVYDQAGGSWTPWSTFNSGAYRAHLTEATAAVAGTPAPTCTTTPGGGLPADQAHQAVVDLARSFLGTPYLWGGSAPGGFDCSGLTSYVYRNAAGITLPRTAAAQFAAATPTTTPQPGDLVFFDDPVGHVGIVLDPTAGTMIDAPHTGAVVTVESYQRWSTLRGFGTFLPTP